MKKIVAVVLALVMVLGLSTVAFADTTAKEFKAEGYSLLNMDNVETAIVDDTFAKIVTDKVVTTVGDKTTTTYFADLYVIDGTDFYACDATIAEAKLVKDGKVVAYLTTADLSAGMTKTATAFVEANVVPACGEFAVDTFVVNGKNYAVGTDEYVLYKGLAVGIAATAETPVAHDFTKAQVSYNTKGEVVSVLCDNCKKSFTVVAAGKVPASYTGLVQSETFGEVLLGAAATTPDADGDKVESAETFDAGIAMYVGMSVMAAAGSAVVLKKKD